MFQETFSQGNSLLHRADPRIKLLATAALALVLALTSAPLTAAAGVALGGALVAAARLPLVAVLKRVLLVNGFIALLWLMLPFSVAGPAVFSLGPLHATLAGAQLALLVTLKANAIVLVMLALLATSHVAALGHALLALGLSPRLGYLLLFSYRYIFVIAEEVQRLRRAARLRCFRPGNRWHSWRTLGWMLGMTLVRAWNRAETVRRAMSLRCFQGVLRSPWELRLKSVDMGLFGALLLAAVALAGLGWLAPS